MKLRIVLYSLLLLILISCGNSSSNQQNLVKQFYVGLNKADFNSISGIIDDNIRITEGIQNLTRSKSGFYTQFQWDSVFSPKYEILEIDEYENGVEATISKECQRILFLNEKPMVYKTKINFKDGRIVRLNTEQYVDLDFKNWQNNLNELSRWMNAHQPDLLGSQNELTIAGAQNYLTAIRLYKEQHQ